MIRLYSILILLVPICIACGTGKKTTELQNKDERKLAFIEYYQTVEGKTIQGNPPAGRRIDSPTYSYNKDSKTIECYRSFTVNNDSTIAIIGTGRILTGAAGGGVSSLLIGINRLPYSYSALTIKAISPKQIKVVFMGKEIIISVGNKWEETTETTDTINIDHIAIVRKVATNRIEFHGFISANDIK